MSSWSVAAAFAAGLALMLIWSAPMRLHRESGAARDRSRWLPVVVTGATAAGLTQVVHGTRLVAGLIALAVAIGIQRLVARSRRTRTAERLAELVLGVCEGMAADLRAGQTPEVALERAAGDWAPLGAVAMAARLGGDVPAALRELSDRTGAGDLRTIAAAWQVSHRSGSGLAAALGQVVGALRERRRTARTVASELASARATAHVLAALPVGVLLMGSGVGGDPVGFLLDTPVGLGCLGLGVALALTGLFWLQHISDAVLTS